ncbi:LLM class F420-dependent oxidoreductase [soil metagenome]
MKFTVEYPVGGPDHDPLLLGRAGVTRVVRRADELGFDAIAFTEHPAPSLRWLEAGGHETLDQTSALAFCAAVTERITLMTHLLVLPYHNPFAAAKALTTVDLLSDGRLVVVAGTGYLKAEFKALGIDFEARNERFDEALEVMRGVWSQVPYEFDGAHFRGRDIAHLPRPFQDGGPPILIGGNSALSRRRAARNHGWSPLLVSQTVAETTRMPYLSVPDLARQITEVRAVATDPAFMVQVQGPQTDVLRTAYDVTAHRDHLGELAEAGVDSFVLQLPCASVDEAVDGLDRFASDFL